MLLFTLMFCQVVKKTETLGLCHAVARYMDLATYMDQSQNVSTHLSGFSGMNAGRKTWRIGNS